MVDLTFIYVGGVFALAGIVKGMIGLGRAEPDGGIAAGTQMTL